MRHDPLPTPRTRVLRALAVGLLLLVGAQLPAVADGRFDDDDGSPHEANIEAVAAAGITEGCAPAAFCPTRVVTRGQLAALLARAHDLPEGAADAFVDDDGSPFEGAVDAVAAAGWTSGCAAGRYCPTAPVTRGQLAKVLAAAYEVPAIDGSPFVDDDGSPFEAAIAALAASGVTHGCTADRYCPTRAVTRAQLASLLARAEGLEPIVPVPDPGAGVPVPDPGADVPDGWPSTLELGVGIGQLSLTEITDRAELGFRYAYLAGGANTGNGWATWWADGRWAPGFARATDEAGLVPVLSYYMLRQTLPGGAMAEVDGVHTNLTTPSAMRAWYQDLRLLFQRLDGVAAGTTVHVEPDLWAFLQQRGGADQPVEVASTGVGELAGLPDTAAGLAQAVVALRDAHAPHVVLGYHYSSWASGVDVSTADPTDARTTELGATVAGFYSSLGADFDVAFHDLTDRDAGFYEFQRGVGGARDYAPADFRRSALFVEAFTAGTGLRTVLWQLPFGNNVMRAVDDTWNHYRDDKVEWFLGAGSRQNLQQHVDAGVVALLFGRGAGGTTCACDAAGDGVTNPPANRGNTRSSLSADDDGGYFWERARAHAAAAPVDLGG